MNKFFEYFLIKNKKSDVFFKEIVIMKYDDTLIKSLEKIDHVPHINSIIYIDGNKYQVSNTCFDYDLKCIKIWVNKY